MHVGLMRRTVFTDELSWGLETDLIVVSTLMLSN